MLTRERQQFSEVFYRQHRKRVIRVLGRMTTLLIVAGVLAGVCVISFFRSNGSVILAVIAAVLSLFSAWVAWRSIRDQFRVRVLPYFERPLGQKDTWLAGENFLQHSRQLDEIAAKLGVRPLSEFASGDDLIRGEVLNWFPPEDALHTLERLLQADTSASLPPAVVSDLTLLRNALHSACSQSAKFCFLVREGSSSSGLELERRKGSFF